MYLLGIDLGTTGCKSMVFDEIGTILGSSYIEYDLIISDEGIEQDANTWWNNVVTSTRLSLKHSGITGTQITALSISSQGISFVPIDTNGKPLQNAISWLDGRAHKEAKAIEKMWGEDYIFQKTGKLIHPCYVLPQLIWLKTHRPDVYKKTFKFLMAHDFIIYKLTGLAVTDLSMASGTLAYDIHTQKWMTELLDNYGIDIDKFPDLMELGQVVETLTPKAALELGLSTNTRVVIGAQDQRCASIGAGISEGIFTISLGTASAIGAISNKPIIDKNMQVNCCGLDQKHWIFETVVSTTGAAFKWLKNTLFPELTYGEMNLLAEKALPLSGGLKFYPLLSADVHGRSNGSFIGISLQTTKEDIIRSTLEGVAFQIRHHILNMERMGILNNEIRLFGGGAESSIWCQIIADITDKLVVIPRTNETANLGAAIIAKMGANGFTNFYQAYSMVGEPKKFFQPDKNNVEMYKDGFRHYIQHATCNI